MWLLPVVTVTIRYAVTMTEEHDGTVGIRELKARLSDFVNRVIYRGETTYITKNNKRVAALVAIEVVNLADAVLAGAPAAEIAEIAARLRQRRISST